MENISHMEGFSKHHGATMLPHIELLKSHDLSTSSNKYRFKQILPFWQFLFLWPYMTSIYSRCCCCLLGFSLSTPRLCTCWGRCECQWDAVFVCKQCGESRKLLEQTDRSSLHSTATGKPLIKQRERNWPSWRYNLYTWNTLSGGAHPTAVRAYAQTYIYPCSQPPKSHSWAKS